MHVWTMEQKRTWEKKTEHEKDIKMLEKASSSGFIILKASHAVMEHCALRKN